MKNKSKEIMEKFKSITHGCRVVMLINRGIKNTNKGSKRWISKLISTSEESLEKNIHILLCQQEYLNDENIRLYMCLNPRNLDRAINHFKHKQIDLFSNDEIESFYTRINDKFCSSLMQPEMRCNSLFLIDWDIKEEPESLLFSVEEVLRYKTPNGWHIIVNSCDPRLITSQLSTEQKLKFELKKDALVLLNTL